VNDKTPEEQVHEWLRVQGYPLEYEAARVLRAGGFRTVQGWSYRGEHDGLVKAREIDILGSWDGTVSEEDGPPHQRARFSVAVECKHMTAPWVVLTTAHPPDWTPLTSVWMNQILREAHLSSAEWFPLEAVVGFSVKTAAAKGQDVAREALMQATNAASAAARKSSDGSGRQRPEWTLPVVVVRGSLFTLGYDDSGVEALRKVTWCRLVWHGADSVDEPTLVDVVTQHHWETYVRELGVTIRGIISRVDEHRSSEQAAWRKRQAEAQAARDARP
jgi:hypothetical protein